MSAPWRPGQPTAGEPPDTAMCQCGHIFILHHSVGGFCTVAVENSDQTNASVVFCGCAFFVVPKATADITEACPCCHGTRVQTRPSDGLVVMCPGCGGKGYVASQFI